MKILNLGCGTDNEGLGIDINPNFKPDIVADICKSLPIKDKFDVVKAIEVLEHVREPRNLIENMLMHVKSEGVCIITTPNALGYEISYRFRGKKKINGSVSQYLTPCVIKGLINRCGGKVVHQNLGSRFWLKHIKIKFKGKNWGKKMKEIRIRIQNKIVEDNLGLPCEINNALSFSRQIIDAVKNGKQVIVFRYDNYDNLK